jgi:putative CocE/NonD family hydrolase
VRAPAYLIGGWYDIFLQDLLADYAALRAAGQQPYLTVGPWQHIDSGLGRQSLQQCLDWLDYHLKGRAGRLREMPVRVYVMGANEWREMPDWPPPASERHYYLQPHAGLAPDLPPIDAGPDHYRYNPGDPTPSLGGPLFMTTAGAVDNAPLEARADVLVYTTSPLAHDLTVIGPVRAELFVHSSLEHTDFFARLCDVHPDGCSYNLCDGIVRLGPGLGERQPDGSLLIAVNMWATANRFAAGNAIRLQISSGAHPRFDRNLGTGELPGKGRDMRIAEQTVYLDAAHPSALVLPVVAG